MIKNWMKLLLCVAAMNAFTTNAAAMNLNHLDGWEFHPAPPSHPFFSSTDPNFKGTLAPSHDKNESTALLVFQAPFSKQLNSVDKVEKWINAKYFKSTAVTIQKASRSEGSKDKYLIVFQINNQDGLRIVPVYFIASEDQFLWLSVESTIETYKKDLKKIAPLVKAL